MSSVRFEPIAIQLSKLVSLDLLLPSDVLEQTRREQPPREPDEPRLEPDVEHFMLHYVSVARAAWQLVGAPQLERLSRLFDQLEEEYMPGGPPMSPVYDSYVSQHILAEVPLGLANETPYTVLARLSSGDPSRVRLHRLAQALADSHLDLYRVKHAAALSAQLEPLRGGAPLAVRLTGPFLRTEDRILARVLPFEDGYFIADSPYLLRASEAEWLDYLERVSRAAAAGNSNVEAAPEEKRSARSAKLTSKARARLRQQQKLAARSKAPEAVIVRHLKYGSSERYWLDFIADGYAGERRGIVYLAGVPDRPETLPHHEAFERPADFDDAEADLPPMPRLRLALLEIAEREGIIAQAERELREGCEQQGLSRSELYEAERLLFLAYCTLGARSEQGLTALEHFEQERQLEPGERALVDSLKRGWFAVLRIDRVHLDEGLEALDVLRRKKLRISERSATRQVGVADLILGWLCEDEQGTLTLEGGVMHVPGMLSPLVMDMAKSIRDQARGALGGNWKLRAAALPPILILGMMVTRERGPLPVLQNTSGHALLLATGRYVVRDRARVVEALGAAFEPREEGTYDWYDASLTLLATFELSGNALSIRVNSRERLAAAKAHVEQLLGDAIQPSLDVLEGDMAGRLRRQLEQGPPAPPPELPPELAAQVHAMVRQRIFATLDEPIPMFQGKTLRQLARTRSTRPDAVSWLREQERFLKKNPQMAGVDLRPIWQELTLDYQGLDTDP